MTNEQYEYNYNENVKYHTKRLQLVVEYTNQKCLETVLKQIKEAMLSGLQEIDTTVKYGGKSYMVYGRQNYKFVRETDMADIDGRTYQIVKSRI